MSKRILITGASGFIGHHLVKALNGSGHQVDGIGRHPDPDSRIWQIDLLETEPTRRIITDHGPFDVVVHLAALAHGQEPPKGETTFSANVGMMKNVLACLAGQQPHFVFLSSVAVYGEDGRRQGVRTTADRRPATEYGRSKVACEDLAFGSALHNVDILRLPPVFDDNHLKDVRKRVFLPGLPLRVRLQPAPTHSLCHVKNVVHRITALIQRGPAGHTLSQVVDQRSYSQNELASWFSGQIISVPVVATKPFYWLAWLIPGSTGYALRCLYWKMFCSNRYEPS